MGALYLLYLVLFLVGSIVLVIDAARAGVPLTPFEAIAAAATTIGNIGPGFGFLGPMGPFEPFSDVSRATLMWMGRLELVPVAVLLTSGYWRR